jgi:hypothetical protein
MNCEWDDCTAQCNGGGTLGMEGTQQRVVMCQRQSDDKKVDDSLCSAQQPESFLYGCNEEACTDFNWMSTPWGACEESASEPGVGIRRRTSHCHSAEGAVVADEDCPDDERPDAEEPCYIHQCPEQLEKKEDKRNFLEKVYEDYTELAITITLVVFGVVLIVIIAVYRRRIYGAGGFFGGGNVAKTRKQMGV